MLVDLDKDGVRARIHAAMVRRVFAYAAVFALGLLLIFLAFTSPPALIWQVLLVGIGATALVTAERLRRATTLEIRLTETAIEDSSGVVLARIDQVVKVNRGSFEFFKPSNGFALQLNERQPFGWAPGMWWRFGKTVGVGGVASAAASKFMAEQIAFQIKERDEGTKPFWTQS